MKRIFILIAALIFSYSTSSICQIVYTDYNPDLFLINQANGINDSIPFDINQDGVNDFQIETKSYFSFVHLSCCWNYRNLVESLNPNMIFAQNGSFHSCGMAYLDSNIWIGNNYVYPTNYTIATFNQQGYIGLCGDSTVDLVKYYPFQFISNSDTLYGWVRVLHTYYSITVLDAAINLTPNTGIYSGAIVTGVFENNSESFKLYPNPTSDFISIYSKNTKRLKTVSITNIFGQTILTTDKTTINLSQLATGIYFVQLRTDNGNYETKVLCKQNGK